MANYKVNDNNQNKYPIISKCSSSRCKCCDMLICKNNIRSSINNRIFNNCISSDLNCHSKDIIYVLTWKAFNCGIQYVGQTSRELKIRCREHYNNIGHKSKHKTYLYQHFQNTGHTVNNLFIQIVEQVIYNTTDSIAIKIQKRFSRELHWF